MLYGVLIVPMQHRGLAVPTTTSNVQPQDFHKNREFVPFGVFKVCVSLLSVSSKQPSGDGTALSRTPPGAIQLIVRDHMSWLGKFPASAELYAQLS